MARTGGVVKRRSNRRRVILTLRVMTSRNTLMSRDVNVALSYKSSINVIMSHYYILSC
jgi:hypothetical protein